MTGNAARRLYNVCFVMALLAAVAGCGNGNNRLLIITITPTPTSTASPTPTATPTPSTVPTGTPLPPGSLVVPNTSGSLLAYAAGSAGNASPILAILGQPTSPDAVALDSHGNVYVANIFENSVVEFAAGSMDIAQPLAVIAGSNTGLNQPVALAVDGLGNIYVANLLGNSITKFATGSSGNAAPVATIAGSNTRLNLPSGLSLDEHDDLYVTVSGAVLEFAGGANGDVPPIANISGANTHLDDPQGVALDRKGNIYVANTSTDSVTEYPSASNGNVAPSNVISGPHTRLKGPRGLALDQTDNLYVSNLSAVVTAYVAGSTGDAAPAGAVNPSAAMGAGIAVDAGGNLFLGNLAANTVEEYPPLIGGKTLAAAPTLAPTAMPTATVTPTARIIPVLTRPVGVALDASGNIYVTNQGIPNVTKFAPGAGGFNPKPLVVISGDRTQLINPAGLAIDHSGNILVADAVKPTAKDPTAPAILEFTATQSGDGAPNQVINGTSTELDTPAGIALDGTDNLWVANQGGDDVLQYAAGKFGNVIPLTTITTSTKCSTTDGTCLTSPIGIAVDDTGNIFVVDGMPSVKEYPAGTTGLTSALPEHTIFGPDTDLNNPVGVAVDHLGNIYVTNDHDDSILEFAPGSDGDAAPLAIIRGTGTGLNQPQYLAIMP